MTPERRDGKPMDVYLVPVGARYELYFEAPDDDVSDDDDQKLGALRGVYARFREMVAEAQEVRRAKRLAAVPSDPSVRQPWTVRVRNWTVSWVAEAIADWRLLWHLRTQRDAILVHPDDLDGAEALEVSMAGLQRDADRHGMRLIVHGVLTAILGPLLFFVPGPNLIAYYFTFFFVGHLLAWRGAGNGLRRVVWRTSESAPLVELREILTLEPAERARHVRDVEARLELEHLAAFVERTLVRSKGRAQTS